MSLSRYKFSSRRVLKKIKSLTALVGRLSPNVGWENVPERRLKTVSFNS